MPRITPFFQFAGLWTRIALLGFLIWPCPSALAQNNAASYPQKPIKILVGFSPGGVPDIVARVLAPKFTDSWKQAVVVENKLGAGSNVAAQAAATSAPDGYTLLSISSAHGEGVRDLIELALEPFAEPEPEAPFNDQDAPKIAIVGRPNVGKSTLVNALLGEERVIAFDEPGTTRDSITMDLERNGKHYKIIDTAGVRKRGKVFEAIEKFSVIKTIQAIEEANVAILVVDAKEGITEQDAHVAAYILETGRALVVAINKWDGLDDDKRDWIKREIDRKLQFLDFAKFHYISALRKKGLPELFTSVDGAYKAAMAKLSTPQLTRVLIDAIAQHQPPISKGIRPKLRYAHQGGSNPPIVVIHGNHVDGVKDSYKRYLEGVFRKTFQLTGTPLRVQFNQGDNPFAEPDKRVQGEGIVSMRRRKTAQRAELNARKNEETKKSKFKASGLEIAKRSTKKSTAKK